MSSLVSIEVGAQSLGWLDAIGNAGTALAAAASFAAIVIAIYTLREMKAQRIHANRPEIAVQRAYVFFRGGKIDPACMGYWTDKEDGLDWLDHPFDDEDGIPPYRLRFVNIGNGVAKHLELTFGFDVKRAIGALNALPDRDYTFEDYSLGTVRAVRYRWTSAGDSELENSVHVTSSPSKDYILPADIDVAGLLV